MTQEQRMAAFMRAFYKAARAPGEKFEIGCEIGEYDTTPPVRTIRFHLDDSTIELTPLETERLALAIMHVGRKLTGEAGEIWEAICNRFARRLLEIVRIYFDSPTIH